MGVEPALRLGVKEPIGVHCCTADQPRAKGRYEENLAHEVSVEQKRSPSMNGDAPV